MEAYAVIPLPFLMLAFKWYCKTTFDDKIHYYMTRAGMKDHEASRTKIFDGKRDRLASRFGHPALYRPLITPMVHASAQNILASVYGGRLTDSNIPGSAESGSVSGYSDTFALNLMQEGRPGQPKTALGVPGFEIVPENRLDFEYYKGRQEFGDEHGGSGGIYGRAEDIIRTDTPGSSTVWGSDSRPGTPVMHHPIPKRDYTGASAVSYDAQGDIGVGGHHNPIYGHRNDSQTGLVHDAADMPLASPPIMVNRTREQSLERRAPGFLGGGPQGYGGLPQHEEDADPMSYDYFRTRRQHRDL
jgi:hypothetical protein